MTRAGRRLAVAALLAAAAGRGAAQVPTPEPRPDSSRGLRAREVAALFRTDSVLDVTIRTDLRGLFGDRDTLRAVWRAGTITWPGPDSELTAPLDLRTRGMYRLRQCEIPPIRLRFADSLVRGTPWRNLRRPKLVSACFDRDNYEQYVLEEYAIYQVLRLFTPISYAARLLRVTYRDVQDRRRPFTRYAFVTEDPDRFARRIGAAQVETTVGAFLPRLDQEYYALLAVFQYFIGNTDWSVPGHHNIALYRVAGATYGVPYDFDWSGVISAPYARPAPQLPINQVSERIYRGYCGQPDEVLEPVLARFEALRDSIADIYRRLSSLQPRNLERTLRYYDEFYRRIADRQHFYRTVVARDCLR